MAKSKVPRFYDPGVQYLQSLRCVAYLDLLFQKMDYFSAMAAILASLFACCVRLVFFSISSC